MATQRNIWPTEGFIDFTVGESRLSTEGSVEATITKSISTLMSKEADKQTAETHRGALNFLLHPSLPENYAATTATEEERGANEMSTGSKIVEEAMKHVGKKFAMGASGPDTFDGPGLISYCYQQAASMALPSTSVDLKASSLGRDVLGANPGADKLKSEVQPGDLVFFGAPVNSAGICKGNGEGTYIYVDKEVKVAQLAGRSDVACVRRYVAEAAAVTDPKLQGVNVNFALALMRAQADMQAAGLVPFVIVSGFRSREKQQELYDLYIAGKGNKAAKPGTSKHEVGLAVDINWSKLGSSQRSWIEANFPSYKIEPPGGMSGNFHKNVEGWHYEWQGPK